MNFHDDWTSDRINPWLPYVQHLAERETAALEVGCYEGRTTSWLMQNVLQHPASIHVALDPFCVNANFMNGHGEAYVDYLPRFVQNTTPWRDRIHIIQARSQIISPETLLSFVPKRFDLIYVDGSHETADVLADARLAYAVSHPGTLIAFDDFGWDSVHDGIAAWLKDTPRPKLQVVFDNYQIMLEVL